MEYYSDLVDALKGLKARGYTLDFNLKKDRIVTADKHCLPHEFEVDEYHRFEGMSNPDDNSIIYAITTDDGRKGTLIAAYGVYDDDASKALIEKLTIKGH